MNSRFNCGGEHPGGAGHAAGRPKRPHDKRGRQGEKAPPPQNKLANTAARDRLAGGSAGRRILWLFGKKPHSSPANEVSLIPSRPSASFRPERRAARYPAPDTNVLYYITGNSADIYKHRRNVAVSRDFRPVIWNGRMEVPANACQNAVAFEACAGRKLLRVNLLGLNHEDNRSTTVICPEGTTAVKAVQWDGKRYTICKQPADESRR